MVYNLEERYHNFIRQDFLFAISLTLTVNTRPLVVKEKLMCHKYFIEVPRVFAPRVKPFQE